MHIRIYHISSKGDHSIFNEAITHLGNLFLHLRHILAGQLVLELLHLGLGVVEDGLGLVDGLHPLAVDLVGLGVGLSLAHHVLNLVLVEAARGLDDDLLLLAGALVPKGKGSED